MSCREPLGLAAAAALLIAAMPAELSRGWNLYHQSKYAAARAIGVEYQRVHGPTFKAAFLVAVADCGIHPHQRANVAGLRQLRVDFQLSSAAESEVDADMPICGPQASSAGLTGQAITVGPGTRAVEEEEFEAPLRHPPAPPPPPRVIASPVVTNAAAGPAGVRPASCRALDSQLARGAAANAATVATLGKVCQRELAAAALVSAPLSAAPPPPPAVALPPEVEAANAERRRRYLAAACREPYVWRDAFRGDRVCVERQVRDDAADDNRHAADRRDPNGPSGPMTCVQGYVWRAARDGDTVCVVPARRDQAAADNAAASSRRASAGVPGSG